LQQLVKVGDTATIDLPDGKTTANGHVTAIGTVATNPNLTSGSGSVGTGQGSTTAQQRAASTTIPVTITLDNPQVAGNLDQAPVLVDIIDKSVSNVLAVPVQALRALPNGGYGVQLTGSSGSDIVPVTTGLFGSGLVEIKGNGLRESMTVQVPAS
jgi:hypothetical protein